MPSALGGRVGMWHLEGLCLWVEGFQQGGKGQILVYEGINKGKADTQVTKDGTRNQSGDLVTTIWSLLPVRAL